jgi:anaerobic nitric oxide reductase transcription regulator
VRELENALSRAILRARGRTHAGETLIVRAADLHGESESGTSVSARLEPRRADPGRPLRDTLLEFQRKEIQSALQHHAGNWAAAARSLGMHRSNLHHLAKRLGLRP